MVTRRARAKPYEIMRKARAGNTLARRKRHVWEKGKGT
jgi:hypothetical protein